MNWSLRIGKVFGIPIRLHWTLLLLVAFPAWGGGAAGMLATGVGLGLLFASVLAHEVAHALTARRYGIGTQDIVLLPFGGMARIDRAPDNGRQEAVIALAGPAMSLALAGLAAVGHAFLPPGTVFATVASTLMWANLMLGVFNLLPAFPMDGGRILRGILERRQGMLRATQFAAKLGRVLAVAMGVASIALGSWSLGMIAVFVWFAGRSEEQMVQARVAYDGSQWRAPQTVGQNTFAARVDGRRFVIEVGPFGYVVREV